MTKIGKLLTLLQLPPQALALKQPPLKTKLLRRKSHNNKKVKNKRRLRKILQKMSMSLLSNLRRKSTFLSGTQRSSQRLI